MIYHMINDETRKKDLSRITDYSNYAKNYLLSIGMTESSINQLIRNLSQ